MDNYEAMKILARICYTLNQNEATKDNKGTIILYGLYENFKGLHTEDIFEWMQIIDNECMIYPTKKSKKLQKKLKLIKDKNMMMVNDIVNFQRYNMTTDDITDFINLVLKSFGCNKCCVANLKRVIENDNCIFCNSYYEE